MRCSKYKYLRCKYKYLRCKCKYLKCKYKYLRYKYKYKYQIQQVWWFVSRSKTYRMTLE